MKKLLIVTVFIFTSGSLLFSQDYYKIDSLCNELLSKYNIKGIGITGIQNGEIVYKGAFGKANEFTEFSDSTRIYIASNTKAFTGLALAKLAFENKLSFSDPITKFIPTTFFPDNINTDKITIKDLMQHTHGLSNDPLTFRTAYSGDYPENIEELLQFISYRNDTLSNEFKYSNLGYLLGGIIIEKVTGQNWKEYIRINIFEPAGMKNTSCDLNFSPDLEVMPYEFYSDNPLSSRKSEKTLHAAGGIYSTLSDMGKWLTLFTSDKQNVFDNELIENYLNERTEVGSKMGPFSMDEYGNGWIFGSLVNFKLFYHFGSFPGYESVMSFQPETKTGVFVFVNERIGGQRIASMLTAYYYLTASGDPQADEKIKMFSQFIDPLYQKTKEIYTFFEYENPEELTGNYKSLKYGDLTVEKDSVGYLFKLGRLQSYTFKGKEKNNILIEWTPGIEESFMFSADGNNTKLIYDDFGEFIKQ